MPALRDAAVRPVADQAPVNFWYDQLARATAGRFGPKAAFKAYRDLLNGSGVDPYREPMFDRVWAAAEPRRHDTIFGLQFDGIEIEGALHWQAHPWREAVGHLCAELADRLLDQVEAARDPWHGFVAFAERWERDRPDGGGFDLTPWQRRFAEAVESGSVPVSQFAAAGRRSGKRWQADVLKAYQDSRGTPEGGEPPIQPTGLAGLREMFDKVQVTEAKQLDYVVVDPSVLPGNHVEGRDGLGKLYLRVPPTAIDQAWTQPLPGLGRALGTVWGIKVYRRQDLPKNWPNPLPDAVSSSP